MPDLRFEESSHGIEIGGETHYDEILYLDEESCLKVDQPGGERVYWFSDSGPEALEEALGSLDYDSVHYLPSGESSYRKTENLEEIESGVENIRVNILDPIGEFLEKKDTNYVRWSNWHGEKESSFSLYPLSHPAIFRKLYDKSNDRFSTQQSDQIVDYTLEELEEQLEE